MFERDIIYGGFYQNIPNNTCNENLNFPGVPNTLLPFNNQSIPNNNYLIDIINKINDLEKKIKVLEKKFSNTNSNLYQDDDSMYMI